MDRKTCKTPMCFKKVWRNGYFTTSDYCWEHDPDVIKVKQKFESRSKEKGSSDEA